MSLKAEIAALENEMIALRRDFHAHPELGLQEERTAEIIATYLGQCGLEVRRMAKTGVVGLLQGSGPGKCLLLRADMDALPINEESGVAYRSQTPGVMHACGHDGHMAMLLVAARVLASRRNSFSGSIKFVFQPNEEDAGAHLLIEEDVLDNPPVHAAVAAHLWPTIPCGSIDLREGPVMAASHYFFLTIRGQGGHAGEIASAIDPILAGSAVVQALQSIQGREISPLNPTAIITTSFKAGSNPTIVPGEAELQGSLRFLHAGGEEIRERLERVASSVCRAHRAGYSLRFKVGNNLLSNDATMTALARRAAEETLAPGNPTAHLQTLGGEDFAEFATRVPAVFYFIGSGNRSKNCHYSLHHPRFNLDEKALAIGTEMHVRTALNFFASDSPVTG